MKKGNMSHTRSLSLAILTALTAFAATAQEKARNKTGILEGPATAKLESHAEVKVPAGFIFLDGNQTRAMMRKSGEPVSGNELGFLRPTNGGWAVYFEFNDIGYIKDAEKEKLDAPKLLQSFKDGTEQANKERIKNGVPPLEVIGWDKEPIYDPTTHNLEWCLRARTEGQFLLNYNTRLLGRKGVMELVLVVDPEDLASTLPEYRKVIEGHQFTTGESYAEYRPGDKLAKYGLGALVLGGAAVGAAKLGLLAWVAVLFKKLGKLVIVVVVAVGVAIKKIFNMITNRSDKNR